MGRLLVVALALSACVRPDLVDCANGTACPNDRVCDDAHGGCVFPAQITDCKDMAKEAPCPSGGSNAVCFDGVCLERGCGNNILEDGELCDDGNLQSGDGCSADCRSDERCGNGYIDRGEECDDGNFISHDDCDSRCLTETPTWTVVPLSPADVMNGAYDVARQRLVLISGGTWETDGTTWTEPSRTAKTGLPYYDTDQSAIRVVSKEGVSQWDGTSWTALADSMPPTEGFGSAQIVAAVYDSLNHRLVIVTSSFVFAAPRIKAYTAAGWSSIATLPSAVDRVVGAYDAVTKRVVLLGLAAAQTLYVLDGATLTSSTTTAPNDSSTQLFSAPDGVYLHHLGTLQKLAGTIWQNVSLNIDDPTGLTFYDTARSTFASAGNNRFTRFTAGTWSETGRAYAEGFSVAVTEDQSFISTQSLIRTSTTPEQTWTLLPTPSQQDPLPSAPSGRYDMRLVSAPGRRGVLASGGLRDNGMGGANYLGELYALDRSGWHLLGSTGSAPTGVGYDPVGRRVVASLGGNIYALDDEQTMPVLIASSRTFDNSFAWDALNHTYVISDGSHLQETADLAQPWAEPPLSPGGVDAVLADERTGGVFTPRFGDENGELWERRGEDFVRYPGPGPIVHVSSTAYRPRDGAAMFLSANGAGGTAYVFQLISTTPDETCVAGEDADGDGLAYCDDPDCYWKCTGCPPYTTCRFDLTPE